MVDSEIAEHMVIDADFSANPHVSNVALAKPCELSCTADAFDGGPEPQGHEDFGSDVIPSDLSLDGPNLLVERVEVEGFDVLPYVSDSVFCGDQLVEANISPLVLETFGTFDAGARPGRIGSIHKLLIALTIGFC